VAGLLVPGALVEIFAVASMPEKSLWHRMRNMFRRILPFQTPQPNI
jgi:hypothetical protein